MRWDSPGFEGIAGTPPPSGGGVNVAGDIQSPIFATADILSISFRKSTPPHNRQLNIPLGIVKNKLTILWGSCPSKTIQWIHCVRWRWGVVCVPARVWTLRARECLVCLCYRLCDLITHTWLHKHTTHPNTWLHKHTTLNPYAWIRCSTSTWTSSRWDTTSSTSTSRTPTSPSTTLRSPHPSVPYALNTWIIFTQHWPQFTKHLPYAPNTEPYSLKNRQTPPPPILVAAMPKVKSHVSCPNQGLPGDFWCQSPTWFGKLTLAITSRLIVGGPLNLGHWTLNTASMHHWAYYFEGVSTFETPRLWGGIHFGTLWTRSGTTTFSTHTMY